MTRKIIKINEEQCNGCGLCAKACHEGAIGMVNGKARLLRDDYCDGLGDCLPACPTGAISFEEREAAEYDQAAVNRHKKTKQESVPVDILKNKSRLSQWPVQIKLAPVSAPYFSNTDLLIAADCTAYAYDDFHNSFIKNKITLIGCPKLDKQDYSEKLTEIFKNNSIRSITVVKMEVPCCRDIEIAVEKAIRNSEKSIPLQIITISTDGRIL